MKIIIDTDPGIDDAFALYYASRCQNLEVLGITTTYGNNYIEQTTRNACFLKQQFTFNCDVWQGCSQPLVKTLLTPGKTHGNNGLGDAFTVASQTTTKGSAVEFIINTVKQFPGEITLVTLGPLTNLALAINQAPEIIPLIRRLVMMGGAFAHHGHRGNVTPVAEFNIYCDPHAADRIFRQKIPIVVVGLDVTHEVVVTEPELQEIATNPQVAMLKQAANHYLNFSDKYEGINGMRIHDALTISYLMLPDAFETIAAPVRVACEGIAAGETIYQSKLTDREMSDWDHNIVHTICIGVDAHAVKNHLLQTIA